MICFSVSKVPRYCGALDLSCSCNRVLTTSAISTAHTQRIQACKLNNPGESARADLHVGRECCNVSASINTYASPRWSLCGPDLPIASTRFPNAIYHHVGFAQRELRVQKKTRLPYYLRARQEQPNPLPPTLPQTLFTPSCIEMDNLLEPYPREGQGRTWVSRFFPNSDVAVARRAKFFDEQDQKVIKTNVLDEKTPSLLEESAPPAVNLPTTEKAMVVEQINGNFIEEETEFEPSTLGWIGAFWNMIAYSIALGILSIPLVVATIGVVPFILVCLFFSAMTYYTGYNYWRLSLMYPNIHSMQQAGELIFGRWGGWLFSTIQIVFGVFLQGNHALLGGIAFRYLGWHSCMVALVAVFSIISFVFTLPRSYKIFAWQAAISFTSIFTVVVIAMIASGISGPENMNPGDPPKRLLAFGATEQVPHNFLDGVLGVTNVFVSFGATPSYLPVMAEMKDRRLFMRSMNLLVGISTVLYIIVGCIVNYNLGQYTKSPSLGSLSPVMIKVSYGLALPTIMIAGCASGQVNAKVLMRNAFSGPRRRFLKKPVVLWTVWILINICTWALAFVLAEVIPFFSAFLSLEASLFWAFFLFLAPLFYIWRHQYDFWSTLRNRIGFLIAVGVICVSTFMCIAGTWSAAVSIKDQYNNGDVGHPFSCTDAGD